MRVVFMGTPDFAVASLKKIQESHHEIVGVITAPDRPAGRGQKLRPSAVKEFASSNNLNILQPTNLKDESFVGELASLNADIFVVVAFRMLPAIVFEMPPKGTINLHGSLLPDYRGAAPINWAIINGETKSGATTFFIEQKIDTGEIIDQVEIDINENMTAGELHDDMMIKGADLLVDTLDKIESGNFTSRPQPKDETSKKAFKIFKDDCRINWKNDTSSIHNHIRGLSPYPAAWTNLLVNNEPLKCKIHLSKKTDRVTSGVIGEIIIEGKSVFVNCGEGVIEILKLQPAGKKAISSTDFINGFKDKNIKFES